MSLVIEPSTAEPPMSSGDLLIERIETVIVDIPTIRPHRFANENIDHQSYVIVKMHTRGGVIGVGEGVTPGGPWWGGESVESMIAMIDSYLSPVVIGCSAGELEKIRARLTKAVPRNHFAKAAVEMAAFDVAGKAMGLPVIQLLGGACRDRLPVTWALSAGDIDEVLEEVRVRLADGYVRFKLKMGAVAPQDDLKRAERVLEAISGTAALTVDPNGSWDETQARWFCRELAERGVESIEQPVPGWNHEAMQRLSHLSEVPLMADESLLSARDAIKLGHNAAAAMFSIKIPKAGGLLNAITMTRIGEVTGRRCFGGSTLETSLGAGAALAVYCSRASISQCELVGPLLLADDIVAQKVKIERGFIYLPSGPGLGLTLDDEKVTHYERR